jgi:hypothetical protein
MNAMRQSGVAAGDDAQGPGLHGQFDPVGAQVHPQVSVGFGPTGRHRSGCHLAGLRQRPHRHRDSQRAQEVTPADVGHLCLPKMSSMLLTSRVAPRRPAVMITDHVPAV